MNALEQTAEQKEKKKQLRRIKKAQSLIEQKSDEVIKTTYGYKCGNIRIYCD